MLAFGALLLYDVAFLVYRRRWRRSTWLTLLLGAGVIALYVFALSVYADARAGDAHPVAVFFACLLGLLGVWFTVTFVIFCIQTARSIHRTPTNPFENVVVLGGGLVGRSVGRLLGNRLEKGIECLLWESSASDRRIVVSGGQGSDEVISEAEAMRDYLLAHGVDDKYIVMEDQSRTTAENLKFSHELIVKLGCAGAGTVVVTNDFHSLRAGILARRAGFVDAQVVSCRTLPYYFPAAFIREFVGYQRVHGKAALAWAALVLVLSVLTCLT